MIDAVLNTDPGSRRSLTAWFFISLYSPSLHLSMFAMAFTSPVFTSITIATPTDALMSFSSFSSARSARSCIPTSIVVTMSAPSIGGTSIMSRNLLSTLRRCFVPFVPRSIESHDSSSPHCAVSLAPYILPMVRSASDPYACLRALNSSKWNPALLPSTNTGSRRTSEKVL